MRDINKSFPNVPLHLLPFFNLNRIGMEKLFCKPDGSEWEAYPLTDLCAFAKDEFCTSSSNIHHEDRFFYPVRNNARLLCSGVECPARFRAVTIGISNGVYFPKILGHSQKGELGLFFFGNDLNGEVEFFFGPF